MNETKRKLGQALGFRLVDDFDPLARTHWLVLDPPEGFELDDHPPEGPDDECYRQILRRGESDFVTDLRVRGCEHRIIRHAEWPLESRMVIERLWHKAVSLAERNAKRNAICNRIEVFAVSAFIGSWVLLFLIAFLSGPMIHLLSLTAEQLESLFTVLKYLSVGLVGVSIGAGLRGA